MVSRLNKNGYLITKEVEHPESFGSRYWVWTNISHRHCFRLIWDGKEQWFVLEESEYKNDSENEDWNDISVVPFDSNIDDPNYWNKISEILMKEIDKNTKYNIK